MVRLKPVAAPLAVAILLRALVLMLALAVAPQGPQFREPDSFGYLALAETLLKTGRFDTAGEPELERTPGYPLLLTPGTALGHVEAVTIALQMALACTTVWLVYQTAHVIYRQERIALTAAWLCAFEPVSMVYTSKLLTETLYTTLLAATVLCLARYCENQRWRDVLLAAVALAAATYVRPISYYLALWVAPILCLILWPDARQRRQRAWQLAAFTALSMTLVGAWQVRNWLVAGYRGFAAISDVNLYYYEALPVVAERQGIPPGKWDQFQIASGENNLAAYLLLHPEQRDWPPARRYAFLRHDAARIIRDDPWRWLRLHVRGIVHTVFDSGRNAWLGFFGLDGTSKVNDAQPGTFHERLAAAWRERPMILTIHGLLAGTLVFYLGLALVGLIAWRPLTPAIMVLMAVGFYFLILSGGAASYHRFRLPLVPMISLFAAAGAATIRKKFGR